MSLFSSAFKSLTGRSITQTVSRLAPAALTTIGVPAPIATAIGAATHLVGPGRSGGIRVQGGRHLVPVPGGRMPERTIPGAGRQVPIPLPGPLRGPGPKRRTRPSEPQFFFGDDKPRRRRMNVLNDRALRRALRRIEGYQRVNKRVEKSLRKACPTPRRRAPARHHHHPAAGG